MLTQWSNFRRLKSISVVILCTCKDDQCYVVSRSALKLDELGVEIATIALPAAMALTADPIASLIDTAFIGQIGIIFIFTLSVSYTQSFEQTYI